MSNRICKLNKNLLMIVYVAYAVLGILLFSVGLSTFEAIIASIQHIKSIDDIANSYFHTGILLNAIGVICLLLGGLVIGDIIRGIRKNVSGVEK